jgi:2-polyprenyl-6-methoxyphenol hydroxylase-like FAD-dependent oxidoreductase
MITTFLSLFGHTRCDREDIAFADFAESHGPGVASQSTRLRDGIYFTLLKRLEAPTSDRKRYTSQEMDKMVQELSDVNIFPHVKLKEIWPLRDQGNVLLLHQEEGLAEKWYHGRVVLVGDAAHKMTSVNGQGALTGVLSATALVNILRAALHRNPTPSTSALEAAFAKYEGARKHVSGQVVDLGKMVTRFITWTGDESESMDRELSQKTNMPEEAKARFVPLFVTSPILDFVPFKGKHGTVPWAMNVDPLIRAQL